MAWKQSLTALSIGGNLFTEGTFSGAVITGLLRLNMVLIMK